MPTAEIGESSSAPPPLIVIQESNKFYDSYMSITGTNTHTRQKLEANTIQVAGELAGSPSDPRRTRSQFKRVLSIKESCFAEKCYLMVESDPHTYEETSEDPRRKITMKEEYHSLQKNETRELVNLPPGRKIVKCKWVFKKNFDGDGSPMKYKASLVAKGFSQVQFIDYNRPLH